MRISQIISAIEAFANPGLQEKWDNTGLQVGNPAIDPECTGVMVCVDPTPAIVQQAAAEGCNLVVSHHPLFFRAVKSITGATLPEQAAMQAIASGISIYSSHTAADSTPGGVSYALAQKLGVRPEKVLSPVSPDDAAAGLGIIGMLDTPLSPEEFVDRVKKSLGCKAVRTSKVAYEPGEKISRVAMCGGAGAEFAQAALEMGAQAYVTADVRYHEFVDYRDKLLLIDAGHFETEAAIKEIFAHVVKEAFPSLKVCVAKDNDNPINYI